MSTKTHDEMIEEAVTWARSLGYNVIEYHLGTETGADAIFQNQFKETVILEVVTGASFRNLFQKQRIRELLLDPRDDAEKEEILLGLIVVGDRIGLMKDHGIEVGLPREFFEPGKKEQKIFPVLVKNFNDLIPVLLVSLLGARASARARLW
jgi:hypothetical protein